MLERAAKPPVDRTGRPPGTNDLAVAFEPDLTGGITGQVAAVGVAEQRTQMQGRGTLFNVDGEIVESGPVELRGQPGAFELVTG